MASHLDQLTKTMHPSRLARHPLTPILLAVIVRAVIGTALPPLSTASGIGPGPGGDRSFAQLVPEEDLADFRTMSRWGTDIQSVEDVQNANAADGSSSELNPELVKLGFIGLTLTATENTVVLTRPDGDTLHLTDGDTLPDGRTLVSVTDNALTLEDATGRRETLVLFPRRAAGQTTEDGPDDGQ